MRSTRQELIELIRRGTDTAEALAAALGVTPSAVRTQLGALQRDGVVERRGVRRLARAGKPALVYAVTAAAEAGRSRAYAPVLANLVASLGETIPEAALRDSLAHAGRQVASRFPVADGDLEARVRAAAAVLDHLGGATRVAVAGGGKDFEIRSAGCPLAEAVAARPEVCEAVRSLVAGLTGAEVSECCDRAERPACTFLVRHPGGAHQGS